MKNLMLSTSMAVMMGGAALAEAHTSAITSYEFNTDRDLLASSLIGMTIYGSESEVDDSGVMASGTEADWEDIGEVNDLVVTRDGEVGAVIIGVGGFLGIGEKDVAVDMSGIRILQSEGGDIFLVVATDRETLEAAESFSTVDESEMGDATDAGATLDDSDTDADSDMAEGEDADMAEGEDADMAEGEGGDMAEGEAEAEGGAAMTDGSDGENEAEMESESESEMESETESESEDSN